MKSKGLVRGAVLTLMLVPLLAVAQSSTSTERWHRVVGILEYVEGDYANALASGDASELAEQQGFADEVLKQLEASGAEGAKYLEAARGIQRAIVAREPTAATLCGALARTLVTEQALVRAPKQPPSLERGAGEYAKVCATCHGPTGAADTELARTLTPPPANFHDEARMRTLTPYKVFNTSSFGIPGTAMAGFGAAMPEDARWAVAFHVMSLRHAACTHQPPVVSLGELATSSDDVLAQKYGANEVACLRRTLPLPRTDTLQLAQSGLDDALERYARGDVDGARQAVVDAYLVGLEPVEPLLRSRNASLVAELEAAFTRTRLAAQNRAYFEAEVLQTKVLLTRAEEETKPSSFWSVFIAALLIMLREGFEAVVVVGALLAVLKKLEAQQQARIVHFGWVSALVVGAAAFVFGNAFFAGANREWMESLVSLLAVGFLLYAALWLNARATMSRFMGELRGKMTHAIGAGSSAGLFFIAFSSVGRESLETALFLQGLAIDSRDGVMWGATAGLGGLLGLVTMVRTVGFKLPMKTLFSASTLLLVVTAVVLLGKGLHGLQELGVLRLMPLVGDAWRSRLQVDMLGLYPDVLSLLPQLVLSVAAALWSRKPRATATPQPG